MLKRIISALIGGVGLTGALGAEPTFSIGSATITPPAGWREQKKEEERITFRSPDGHQQATVSFTRFARKPSFEDFKKLCDHRIAAERKELSDSSVLADPPFEAAGAFGMFFSGADKNMRRAFSGYLTLKDQELITIYVEGTGVTFKDEAESFKVFVRGLKRK